MRGTLCYCASRCFQLGQPAELQILNHQNLPIPFHIPPHNHLHPWLTHRGRGTHPAGNLHPWDISKQHELRAQACQRGLQTALQDPRGEEFGVGDPIFTPAKRGAPLPRQAAPAPAAPAIQAEQMARATLTASLSSRHRRAASQQGGGGGGDGFFFLKYIFPWNFDFL